MKVLIPLRLTKRELAAFLDNCLIDMNSQINGVYLKPIMSQLVKHLSRALPKKETPCA
jgi:hypothetical protein